MPTLVADLHQLAAAVDPQRPSGDDLTYTDGYARMERLARGREEQQYGQTIYEAQEPHWESLQEHARSLAVRTHDLRVGVYLTQALTRTQGLCGFADGLELVTSWLVNEWDTVHPALDPDDGGEAVERSNILLELCDYERTLSGLLRAPLASSREVGACALAEIRVARGDSRPAGGRNHLTLPEIHAIFATADRSEVESRRDDVNRAAKCVERIEHTFRRQTGTFPNLAPLATLLAEIRGAMDEFLPPRAPDRPVAAEVIAGTMPAAAGPPVCALRLQIGNRQEVVAALNAVCDYYNRSEPSSPVPLLLRRARQLVDMDFVDIVRNLAPDGLADVSRWAGGLSAVDQN